MRGWRIAAGLGLGIVILAAVVVVAVPGTRQRVLPPGPTGLHDASVLPERLVVCGRTYRNNHSRPMAWQEVVAMGGESSPLLVDTGLFDPCPSGACTTQSQPGPCATLIFVRVGADAYMTYTLSGGP